MELFNFKIEKKRKFNKFKIHLKIKKKNRKYKSKVLFNRVSTVQNYKKYTKN